MQPGKVRIKLAAMLAAAFPDYNVVPEELYLQNPVYIAQESGCCRWFAHLKHKDGSAKILNILSWDKMTECVKQGIDRRDPPQETVISAKE